MRTLLLLIFLLNMTVSLLAQQPTLDYYLPDENFDPAIPTPASVLGYQVGEWHASHDQLVMYFRELAAASDRITIKEFGRSYENRPLLVMTITNKENHKNLETIRKDHLRFLEDGAARSDSDQPVVLYQGYSIHGNEASGSNAALLYAYYLAASRSEKVANYLKNAIVLLDPSFNPDGFNRFSSWVNQHKNKNLTSDPADREYNEAFPGGRTNHYWFDLNRDWLPTQHPESQGRIRNFHEWYPNILTDHHEMGTNNTFFFQPGIPSRTNPITPKMNQELTGKIAEFHAEALDEIGSLYYSKESFDDFYYGKGSTYPDVKGSIGILFEQASSRGHLQESANGLLSFPFTIRNQLRTSISTLKAGVNLRKELLDYQHSFYKSAKSEANNNSVKGYIFGGGKDQYRTREFLKILKRHHIRVNHGGADKTIDGQKFPEKSSYTVSMNQPQYRLIRAIFEQTKTFPDSLFYDVSAWTLPLAFDLPYAEVGAGDLGSQEVLEAELKNPTVDNFKKSDYAYILGWDEYLAPGALYALQKAGLKTKLTNRSFKEKERQENGAMNTGSILIPVKNNQSLNSDKIFTLMKQIQSEYAVTIRSISSGNTEGVNLGSPSFTALQKPKVLLLVGRGVTSYDAGEVWHLLDQRYNMEVTMVETDRLERIDLSKYNVIIMPNGSYYELTAVDDLKDWIKDGGTLIAMRGAISWAKGKGIANVKYKTNSTDKKKKRIPYDRRSDISGAQVIGGAIFQTKADLTHPLLYGYHRNKIPVFHRGTLFLEPGSNSYATPLIYTNDPVMSGYISDKNLKRLKKSAAISVNSLGRGRVISMVPNPNFRAFWYGTNKLFANAIFFGNTINRSAMNSAPPTPKKQKK